ncbi:MAG TPA: hypothetical protein VHG08_17725 [Longimicrobium sp.]|nr:hypothetical protein [Longimicrobium sp.]
MRTILALPRRLAILAALACAALPGALDAQVEPRPAPAAFCWTAQPGESCRAFLLVEGGAYLLLGGSRYVRTDFDGSRDRERHLTGHVGLEVGALANVSMRDALGATLLVGADANGERVALKGRWRRWTSPRTALDLGAGALIARRAEPRLPGEPGNDHVPVRGLTADLSVGFTEWASASLRGELLFDDDGQAASGVYSGVKLGPRPTAVAAAAPFVFAALIFIFGVGRT